jgi:hypothetical protein
MTTVDQSVIRSSPIHHLFRSASGILPKGKGKEKEKPKILQTGFDPPLAVVDVDDPVIA